MRKFLVGIIGLFVVLAITACSSDTSSSAKDINGNEKSSFAINETAIYEDVHYTITDVEYSNGDEYDEPASGNHYVKVTIKIENKSDAKISYNAFDWTMLNSSGQEDEEAITLIDTDTNLGSGDLVAGGSKTGTIVFEQPKNESSLKLLYYSNILFDENSAFEIIIK